MTDMNHQNEKPAVAAAGDSVMQFATQSYNNSTFPATFYKHEGYPKVTPDLSSIPDWLKHLTFGVWIAEPRPGKPGKYNKAPRVPQTGIKAGADKPYLFGTFHEACVALQTGKYSGLGVILDGSIVGIDIDDYSTQPPEIKSWVGGALLDGAYCERSPGGDGLRIFVCGSLPGTGRKSAGLEIYDDVRFLTATGVMHPGSGYDLIDGQELINEFLEFLPAESSNTPQISQPNQEPASTDAVNTVIQAVMASHPELWNGGWESIVNVFNGTQLYPSQSEADFALLYHLAQATIRTEPDSSRHFCTIYDAFRLSGLYRAEKDEQIRNYGIPKQLAKVVSPAGSNSANIGCKTESEPDTEFDWPDPKPINTPLPNVEPFDFAMLPPVLRRFVIDCSERMQCPPDYLGASALVFLSAVIGNRIAICPKRKDTGWRVIPVLWGGIVGRPGSMKSPAIGEVRRRLKRVESELDQEYIDEFNQYSMDKILYDAALKTAKSKIAKGENISLPSEPKAPGHKRLVVNDSTVQKLAEILNVSPNGVIVERDEIVALLESLETDGQETARGFYLEGWNGNGTYRVDRVGKGSFVIERVAIWVFGGIQPGKLQFYIAAARKGGGGDDGLLQRFQILVWPDKAERWVNIDRLPDMQASADVDQLIKALKDLNLNAIEATADMFGCGTPYLHFTDEAQKIFDAWREQHENDLPNAEHPALESHFSKYRSLIPAIALVLHLILEGTGPVTSEALEMAFRWDKYLRSHARRVYAKADNPDTAAAHAILERIQQYKLQDGFTARDITQKDWQHLVQTQVVQGGLDLLVEFGWLRQVDRNPGPMGGRKTSVYYINPKAQEVS
jgi:putative DNA primase/helicase